MASLNSTVQLSCSSSSSSSSYANSDSLAVAASSNAIVASTGLLGILQIFETIHQSFKRKEDGSFGHINFDQVVTYHDSKRTLIDYDGYGEKNTGSTLRVERPPFEYMKTFRRRNGPQGLVHVFSSMRYKQFLDEKDDSGESV